MNRLTRLKETYSGFSKRFKVFSPIIHLIEILAIVIFPLNIHSHDAIRRQVTHVDLMWGSSCQMLRLVPLDAIARRKQRLNTEHYISRIFDWRSSKRNWLFTLLVKTKRIFEMKLLVLWMVLLVVALQDYDGRVAFTKSIKAKNQVNACGTPQYISVMSS